MRVSNKEFIASSASRLILFQRLTDPLFAVGLLLILSDIYRVPFDRPYILLSAISVLLIPSLFSSMGRYAWHCYDSLFDEFWRIVAGWVCILSVLLFLGYCTKSSAIFSRSVLLSWAFYVPFTLLLIHFCTRSALHWIYRSGYKSRLAVIVGSGSLAQRLAVQIKQSPHYGIKVCGFFDDGLQDSSFNENLLYLGDLEQLPHFVKKHKIEIVYITPSVNKKAFDVLVKELQDTTVCMYFIPELLVNSLGLIKTRQINGIPLVTIWESPYHDLGYDLKQVFDYVFASVALIILAPLMLVIAIAIKLTSPGPILFKQRRYGLNGQEIVIYKFRTMKVMEDGDVVIQAQRHDRRVTKLGAILRRTSLDELPQLINVLQGRMSIVGPRPHAIAHNETYRKLISGYMLRHKVKPGLTGWAQVHGLRGGTDSLEKMEKRIEYDLEYLRIWSLALDIKIILRTIVIVLTGRNAY